MTLIRRKRFWIAGLLFLSPILLLVFAHLHGKWSLARLKKQLVQRGEKLTVGENEPRYGAGENGFRPLMQAVGQARGSSAGSLLPPMTRAPLPSTLVPLRYLTNWTSSGRSNVNWVTLATAMEPFSNALAEAKSLLHESVLDPRLDFRLGFSIPLPHLAQLKGFSQNLTAAAILALQAGQLDTAKDHIKDTLATADIMEREPLLISQLVRYAILSIAANSTWHALQYPGWTEPQLLDLQRTWQSVEVLPQLSAALEMERAICIDAFGNMRRSGKMLNDYLTGGVNNNASDPGEFFSQAATRSVLVPIWQFSLSYGDERHYLEGFQAQLELVRSSAQQRSGVSSRGAAEQAEQASREGGLQRLRHLMSHTLASAVGRTLERALQAETQKELAVAALALQRYALRHGHMPATLDQLVPEFVEAVPRDYFAGAPLLYRTNAAAAPLLYSIGADGKDGGGDATAPAGSAIPASFNGRDVVWPTAIPEDKLEVAFKYLDCNVTNASKLAPRSGRQ